MKIVRLLLIATKIRCIECFRKGSFAHIEREGKRGNYRSCPMLWGKRGKRGREKGVGGLGRRFYIPTYAFLCMVFVKTCYVSDTSSLNIYRFFFSNESEQYEKTFIEWLFIEHFLPCWFYAGGLLLDPPPTFIKHSQMLPMTIWSVLLLLFPEDGILAN